MEQYIVVIQQIVGNAEIGFHTLYNWDCEKFDTRAGAIDHGFEIRGSDDFNTARIIDGRLVSFDWMDEAVESNRDVISQIAKDIGLSGPAN